MILLQKHSFGQIIRSFSANRSTIHLKTANNLTQNLIAVAEPLAVAEPPGVVALLANEPLSPTDSWCHIR